MVSSGLGVIGDIGKKTYNILLEDDEDSNTARKTNVSTLFMLFYLYVEFAVFFLTCIFFLIFSEMRIDFVVVAVATEC